MPITMKCPGCRTAFDFPSELDGKRIKCKSCGDIFRVEKPVKKLPDQDEDDDRPMPAPRRSSGSSRSSATRSRRSSRGDDERPPSRTRKIVADYDDEEDERPSHRRDVDDDDAPKKRNLKPLLIFGPIAGLFLVVVVVAILVLRGRSKNGNDETGEIIQASANSCELEIPVSDMGTLVVPDSGNIFGILHKAESRKKEWVFESYDIASGKKVGRVDMKDMEEPRSASISPDGKHLLIIEGGGSARSEATVSVWSIQDNQPLAARKWNPYPRLPKAGVNSPGLYRAEFVGNDKLVTFSTGRIMDVWPLPTFDPPFISGAIYRYSGDQLGQDDRHVHPPHKNDKYQRESAFTADHKMMAMWNGDGFTFASLIDGQEVGRTISALNLAKEIWEGVRRAEDVRAGPIAFSPDGKTLASVISYGLGTSKKFILCLWEVNEQRPPEIHLFASNQYNDAPALYWWGNRFVVTHGGLTEGMMFEVGTRKERRQVMGPAYGDYSFGRDGRLWYASSDERTQNPKVHVVDGLNPDLLKEPDDYEQNTTLNDEFFLRRLWLEPTGVTRAPIRYNPPLNKRLIRRP